VPAQIHAELEAGVLESIEGGRRQAIALEMAIVLPFNSSRWPSFS